MGSIKPKYERFIEKLEQSNKFLLEVGRVKSLMTRGILLDEVVKKCDRLTDTAINILQLKISETERVFFQQTLAFYIIRGSDRIRPFTRRNPFGINAIPFNEFIKEYEETMDKEKYVGTLDEIKEEMKNGLVLFIRPEVSKAELKDFIEQKSIVLNTSDQKGSRFRAYSKSKDHKEIMRIYKLYSTKSITELRDIVGKNTRDCYSRYDAISFIMKKHGIKITPQTLQKTVARMKKAQRE